MAVVLVCGQEIKRNEYKKTCGEWPKVASEVVQMILLLLSDNPRN